MIKYDNTEWFFIIFRIKGNVIVSVLPQMVLNFLVGIGAYLSYSPEFGNGFVISPSAHSQMTMVVAFLIVIRTQISYARYWEGRGFLGLTVKASRVIMMSAITHINVQSAAGMKSLLEVQRLLNLIWALQNQQLQECGEVSDLSELLSRDESLQLEAVDDNRALIAVCWLKMRLQEMWEVGVICDGKALYRLHDEIHFLVEAFNGATKIANTPIPFAYIQILRTFLALIVYTLPFSLSETLAGAAIWATPVLSAMIAFAFYGTDFLGAEIEQPFGDDPNDLPMETLGKSISADLTNIIQAASQQKLGLSMSSQDTNVDSVLWDRNHNAPALDELVLHRVSGASTGQVVQARVSFGPNSIANIKAGIFNGKSQAVHPCT